MDEGQNEGIHRGLRKECLVSHMELRRPVIGNGSAGNWVVAYVLATGTKLGCATLNNFHPLAAAPHGPFLLVREENSAEQGSALFGV